MEITIREQLHQQIDNLPDEIVEKIAQFTLSITNDYDINVAQYTDWQKKGWQEFSLSQFFSDDDDIEYYLEDAQEIY
ncbi:hypothetical protein A5482_013805 [Cyanobacterium sp. IPPAS B-1200]|uniref:hypothetical protein n=1 Tax=Cyanobacterium sp. IPPAS B-1200 TaxID=1562720 RepID=UPI0008524C1D|nr:hypothetical protein [Cyanobacterium sp. IPPAS B-1200]OEJ78559.1 hypothetical protein A5482_12415 [Cyanobacterium sp. IPPAS B-1200]